MWNRRLELNLLSAVMNVFRHTHPAMKEMESPQVLEWAEANKPRVIDFLAILDAELENQLFVAGDHFTVADITGLVAVDFLPAAGLGHADGVGNVLRRDRG